MDDKVIVKQSGGIGFLGMLTLIFVTLKLTGFIAWSWWWVLAPTWIPLVILFGFLAFVFLLILITEVRKQ